VTLEDLPYPYNALEPHIGERTLRIHHDKHHAKYVTTTKEMIKGTEHENASLETIIRSSFGKNQGLFNNAGQSFNHDFYWKSMKAGGGGKPSGQLAKMIDKDFGSYDKFRTEFTKAANTAFGSGWAWLVWTPSGLKVRKSLFSSLRLLLLLFLSSRCPSLTLPSKVTQTIGANNPLTDKDSIPLLNIDVWEHAYYLDYQNLRPDYVETFMNHLVNWDAVANRLPKK
jgi:Fe-Mn family superoxide dismutase